MGRSPGLGTQFRTFLDNPGNALKVGLGKLQQTLLDAAGRCRGIYDSDWDLLVILDACRADVARTVTDDYEFLDDFEVAYSKGSTSRQWMRNNFTSDYRAEMRQTTYVTANPFSEEMFDDADFDNLEEVWRYATDDELGVVPPRPVTDRAIDIGRRQGFERMIVHYMQPHKPLVNRPEYDYVTALERGEISRQEALDYHEDNLEAVLDDVELLLNNVDAEEVVITADHGEGLGERGIYNHPYHRIHPCLRHVPWWETTARDTGTYTPETTPESDERADVEERLRDLGYKR